MKAGIVTICIYFEITNNEDNNEIGSFDLSLATSLGEEKRNSKQFYHTFFVLFSLKRRTKSIE